MKDLAQGMTVRDTFVVTEEEMAAFSTLSGDHNPLHRDADYARLHGLRGPVVYGGLLVAKYPGCWGCSCPERDGFGTN